MTEDDSMSKMATEKRGNGNKGNGAIAVIAKCPIPGKSKTRLIPLLGLNGSVNLAKAMLSDILLTLDQCVSRNHLLTVKA